MFFNHFLSSIFGAYPPALAIFIFTLAVLFITQLPYKFLVDQDKVKHLKGRQKELSKKMKEVQKDGNIEKANEYMSEAMKLNHQIMKMTFKPLIISFAIFILVIPWLRADYGDISVTLQNNTGSFDFIGKGYNLTLSREGGNITILDTENGNTTSLAVARNQEFAGRQWNVLLSDQRLLMQQVITYLPTRLPLIGDDIGWLLFYFMVSMPIILVLKKIMGIAI